MQLSTPCLCSQMGPREPMSESEAPLPSECLTGRAQKELRESCRAPAHLQLLWGQTRTGRAGYAWFLVCSS